MNYTDKELQDHELKFWIDAKKPRLLHQDFYKEFYDFNELTPFT